MRRLATILVTTAMLLAAGGTTAAAAPQWTTNPAPVKQPATLSDVVAFSGADAWAVGNYYYLLQGQWAPRSLMLHWDGTGWRRVSLPESGGEMDALSHISATGRDNMWAFGFGDYLLRSTGDGAWERIPMHTARGFHANSVTAARFGVWVAGEINAPRSRKPAVARFDGTTWSTTVLPSPEDTRVGITEIATVPGTRKAVAVGYLYPARSYEERPYLAFFNGTSWARQKPPRGRNMSLMSVVALSARNMWAVGFRSDESRGVSVPLVMRYRPRTGWRAVRYPQVGPGAAGLYSVAAHGPRNVVMVGSEDKEVSGSTGSRTLALRYNGSKLVRQATPNPTAATTAQHSLMSVTTVPGSAKYWAVGWRSRDFAIRGHRALILQGR